MISISRYRVLLFSFVFILISYLVIIKHNISYLIIPFFVIPLSLLEYKDFELRFFLLSFVFFLSFVVNKVFHTEKAEFFVYNLIAFISVFSFSVLKSFRDKKDMEEKEKSKLKLIEIKKETDDIKSKIDFYKKYREKVTINLSSKQKVISCLKEIQTSLSSGEIASNLMKSILLLFPGSKSEFIISPKHSKIVEDVFKTLTSIYVPSVSKETRYNYSDFSTEERSSVYFPISAFSRCLAVVKVYSDKEDYFSVEDFRVLEIFATTASIAMENLSLYMTTEELARKDPLTGLFTHRSFQDKLDEEILVSARTKKPLSLAILDIDHFKKINDNYGHQSGDDVLKKLAEVISINVREVDFVARYGGEEFAVIMPQISKKEALNILNNIRNKVKSLEFNSENRRFRITLSIGVGEFPLEATSKNQMIRISDERLYKAKKEGRDRIIYE
ncbi:MAG: sensor domain-containing diguanylate cyclase [Elusimicrobiales bacterium]|nr:sensor domain-containing diguanylate cyclase [Elusimicrobiales bacterium]